MGGWVLALERAPQFLAAILLFILPFLTQWHGADKLLPKWAITQLLVLLMLSVWVLRVALTGKLTWVYSRAHLILLVLMIWIVLTCFLSPYPQVGSFSNAGRYGLSPLVSVADLYLCRALAG